MSDRRYTPVVERIAHQLDQHDHHHAGRNDRWTGSIDAAIGTRIAAECTCDAIVLATRTDHRGRPVGRRVHDTNCALAQHLRGTGGGIADASPLSVGQDPGLSVCVGGRVPHGGGS